MAAMVEYLVTLKVTRPADASSPVEWDWPNVMDEPEVELQSCTSRYFERDEEEG